MMSREVSREERIISKLEFIEYVYQKYPDILKEWSNGPNKATTGHQTDLAEGEDIATLTLKDFVNESVDYDIELVSLWRKYSVGGIYE
jgi:hypothetical protein